MRAFFALKAIMEKDMVYVTERLKVNVVCGELKQNEWYLRCDEPKLGTADCVVLGPEKQTVYLYLIEG